MTAPCWVETGSGPHGLVFLHGISGGASGALDILPRITPAGWRGLAWDMPGYGASAPIEPVDFDGYARALEALLDAAGLERAVLVGHSMGGMIALQAAATFPNRIAGLVLACCTPAFGASAGPLQQAFLDRRLGPLDDGASMRELAVEVIPTMVGPGGDPEVVGDAVRLMAEIPPDSYRAAMHALVTFDQRAALSGLSMAALVIAGRDDTVSTPPVVRRMAERMPAATYLELDAGHLAPFEEPEAFAAAVQDFLAGLDNAPVTFLL
jgi:3-oxoadipate enol-lactonase